MGNSDWPLLGKIATLLVVASLVVVDDDAGSLKLMSATLEQHGDVCHCVRRGDDGPQAANDSASLAAVLDLIMPELVGPPK